jgi:hypothetical protein
MVDANVPHPKNVFFINATVVYEPNILKLNF